MQAVALAQVPPVCTCSRCSKATPLHLDFSSFGTKKTPIPDVARRGITRRQMRALKAFIEKQADENGVLHGWLVGDPKSEHYGKPNRVDTLNLYDQLPEPNRNPGELKASKSRF